MTNPQGISVEGSENARVPRELACSRCGTLFGCNPQGPCWCADETFRLPMPVDGSDCLCPDCLRRLAGGADELSISSA